MPDDKIQDLARIFTELVRTHGVEVVVMKLPDDVWMMLLKYFAVQAAAIPNPYHVAKG